MSNNSSLNSTPDECNESVLVVSIVITVIEVAFLVPPYTLVLYLGLQQWRQKHSFATASHSDIITYHATALRLVWILATGIFIWTPATADQQIKLFTHCLLNITWDGENFFHVLTCVERYLAAVHPIVYMKLRNAHGVRIRNISIGCVWLLSLACSSLSYIDFTTQFPILFLVPFALCLIVVSFCSLSVLCVLIRPGPGDGGRDRRRVDQSKQRAFFTITAILVVLWLWLGGILVSYSISSSTRVSVDVRCLVVTCAFMFNLPCGLVLPLLFLHRAGKLSLCFHNKG